MSRFLNEFDAKNLLAEYGVPMVKSRVAHTKEEAEKITDEIKFPAVMKVLSADIQHKTEAGCVFLGVEKDKANEIFDKICDNARTYAPEAVIDGILIQEMADSSLEVIVGMKKDPQFGPVLMVGLGGIYVEVFQDVSLRLLPIDRQEVQRMLEETRLYKIIKGARGTRYDEETLIDVLLSISKMSLEQPDIEEIDINPLFLYEEGKGAKGVDALIRM